jgi:hypothetical protein
MNIKDVSSALGVGKARACWVKFYPTNQPNQSHKSKHLPKGNRVKIQ